MRDLPALGVLVAATCFVLGPASAHAQDPVQAAPKHFKVLLENEQVRVLEYQAKEGDKVPMHSHPDHVIYIVKGGKARFATPDGKSQDTDSKAGEVRWTAAGSHSTEALSESLVILVELKKK